MASTELVKVSKFRTRVPTQHRTSVDTRIQWLWNQRFGTVQQVMEHSPDVLDHTAAQLIFRAIVGNDLECIQQIFQRLEGAPVTDDKLNNEGMMRL